MVTPHYGNLSFHVDRKLSSEHLRLGYRAVPYIRLPAARPQRGTSPTVRPPATRAPADSQFPSRLRYIDDPQHQRDIMTSAGPTRPVSSQRHTPHPRPPPPPPRSSLHGLWMPRLELAAMAHVLRGSRLRPHRPAGRDDPATTGEARGPTLGPSRARASAVDHQWPTITALGRPQASDHRALLRPA